MARASRIIPIIKMSLYPAGSAFERYKEPVIWLEYTPGKLPGAGTIVLGKILNKPGEITIDPQTRAQWGRRRYHRSQPILIVDAVELLKERFWPTFEEEAEGKDQEYRKRKSRKKKVEKVK